MVLLALLGPAHATGMTICRASLLPDGPGTRIHVSCQGSSSAPGGPVSRSSVAVPDAPITLHLRGIEVAAFARAETRADGTAVYATDLVLEPGLGYIIDGLHLHDVVSTPDIEPLTRCSTNPDTCVRSAKRVPVALGPALRMGACVGRESCEEARADPLTDDVRAMVELSCISFNRLACAWMAEIEPATHWEWVDAALPGRGNQASTGVRFFVLPQPLAVGWTDEIPSDPVLSATGDDTAQPAGSRSGFGARWTEDGVAVQRRKKVVWRWPVSGVEGVALRPDGQQLLVRSGRLVAWVAFDNQPMPAFQGLPAAPHGKPAAGKIVRADGWPAAGTRVSAPCTAEDAGFSCTDVADILGRYSLAGMHGSTVRVEGPHVGGSRVLTAVEGLPVRIPDTDRVFDFEVDGGRVTRAAEPLQVGDVVVKVGPLPVDREPAGIAPVPPEAWPGLATSWGSVEVLRGEQRVVLR